MSAHANARSFPNCRAVMVRLVAERGQAVREVAATFDLSPQTVYKWINRHCEGGRSSLENRSIYSVARSVQNRRPDLGSVWLAPTVA